MRVLGCARYLTARCRRSLEVRKRVAHCAASTSVVSPGNTAVQGRRQKRARRRRKLRMSGSFRRKREIVFESGSGSGYALCLMYPLFREDESKTRTSGRGYRPDARHVHWSQPLLIWLMLTLVSWILIKDNGRRSPLMEEAGGSVRKGTSSNHLSDDPGVEVLLSILIHAVHLIRGRKTMWPDDG